MEMITVIIYRDEKQMYSIIEKTTYKKVDVQRYCTVPANNKLHKRKVGQTNRGKSVSNYKENEHLKVSGPQISSANRKSANLRT
jgi:hypothetical protein